MLSHLSLFVLLCFRPIFCSGHYKTPQAGLTIVTSSSFDTNEYSNLEKVIQEKSSIGLAVKIVDSIQELERHRENVQQHHVPHFVFGNFVA
jgi:hypothetical protein